MADFEHILLNILENKRAKNLENGANVRINLYFHIPSKTQFCQKCHLRISCIQPTICRILYENASRTEACILPNIDPNKMQWYLDGCDVNLLGEDKEVKIKK